MVKAKLPMQDTIQQPVQSPGSQQVRVQFSLGQDSVHRLKTIQGRTGAGSRSEVVRSALRVYDYLSEEEAKGHRILIEQDDKTFVQLKIV